MFSSFYFVFNYLYNKYASKLNDEKILKLLVNNSFNGSLSNYQLFDLKRMNSTNFLVKYSLGIDLNKTDFVTETDDSEHISTKTSDYVEDPAPVDINNPIVYIYNSHQTEAYDKTNLEAYNITPTVMMASYILRERLNDLGIPSIVETGNITNILNNNNWSYGYSYKASRILIENALASNASIKYLIDIHRDSVGHDLSTITINDINYAKIMFVIGSEYDTYESNLAFAKQLRLKIDELYPGLCRGIAVKSGKGVNGVYNQDLSPRAILIEIGAQYNNIEEVNNTTGIIADVLFSYIEGEQV
ncbi:MAG: stage II sporulation protein P [Bacilli bacterium]|nr:stage II sporulation protein P [Bacilli bacterium]